MRANFKIWCAKHAVVVSLVAFLLLVPILRLADQAIGGINQDESLLESIVVLIMMLLYFWVFSALTGIKWRAFILAKRTAEDKEEEI